MTRLYVSLSKNGCHFVVLTGSYDFFAVMHITVSSCIKNVMSCPSNRTKKICEIQKKYFELVQMISDLIKNCSSVLNFCFFHAQMAKVLIQSKMWLLECTKLEIQKICKIFAKIVTTCLLSKQKQQQQSQLHCS